MKAIVRDPSWCTSFNNVLDHFVSEHMKHREMLVAIDRLADLPAFDSKEITRLAEFIRVDLAIHAFEDEHEFFPLLGRYCRPDDELGAVLTRMRGEPGEDIDLCANARVALLDAITSARPLREIAGASQNLHAFAQNQRRHVVLENAILIPLARRRLFPEAVAQLGARLFAGRRS